MTTENVFALGDVALIESDIYPKEFPQLASVVIDQSKNLANISFAISKNTLVSFQYLNKDSMESIGKNKAVVDLAKPKLTFHGFFAWLIWMTLYFFYLLVLKTD